MAINFKTLVASFRGVRSSIDPFMIIPAGLLVAGGLVTISSFRGDSQFFLKQLFAALLALAVLLCFSFIDFRFLRRTRVVVAIFGITATLLLGLFIAGKVVQGAQSWFDFGIFAFQPVDIAKVALIILLAKYFSRRHMEIAHIRHIIVSGFYAFIVFILVLFQPDFGSAIIIFLIWLGMILVSGVSKKHLAGVFALALISAATLWFFVFENYQKVRIYSFLNPLADVRGSGYNASQAMIAVGSGGLWGKGIGYGTQSRLKFLPEYETDFIFAAFAEEWGFFGSLLVLGLYGIIILRIIAVARRGATNFETLFGYGVAVYFISHIVIHIGINIGLLPVTGITIPFLSYGGSHLLAEAVCLGILSGMRRYRRGVAQEKFQAEFLAF